MVHDWTESQFLELSERYRHKIAAQLLRTNNLSSYRRVERWLNLPPLDENNFPSFSDRYHDHLIKAELDLKEYNLLESPTHQVDTPSETPYLPITIYLDHLRSAFNVGSILRTTEAFRLGTLCFSSRTPTHENPKVQKTSMWTHDKVPCIQQELKDLPRPWIALETVPDAPSIFTYSFPPSFTLLIGNEEYGIHPDHLAQCDAAVQIPLHGFKHSLNVASAYAIAAATISHQLR